MSDYAIEHGQPALREDPHDAHPGPAVYLVIAGILTVLTAAEITVFYVSALQPVLVPILLVLAAVKFAFVGGFYMHLYYDSKVFTIFFGGPLMLAFLIVLSLLLLFWHLSGVLSFTVP
ncbi:MAG TPA: cytochrome C oxidase subunit IV family protein [Candidatus Binataceae bacterium]|nr:cytochrome C oxidase subunit IV family protein [Candidatus Binataceae bacterium]